MDFNKEKLSSARIRKTERRIAYFSMEIGIRPEIPTYSGGLGVLAGDTIKSCADLNVPLVVVSLLYKKGYFYQELDEWGNQQEMPYKWNPKQYLKLLKKKVTLTIENRTVFIQAWQYEALGISGYRVPVIFLDTDKLIDTPTPKPKKERAGTDLGYRWSKKDVCVYYTYSCASRERSTG